MALKLDIKNDTIIPSKAFQDWANLVLTEKGIKTSVDIPLIGELFKRDKDLQNKLIELKTKIDRCPAGSDIWFSKMFLWPFGGKVTDAAKTYFKELGNKGHLANLEEGAKQAAADRQTNGAKLAAACAAALDLLENPTDGLPAAVGALSIALSTTTAAPAAVVVTANSLYDIFNTAIQGEAEPPAATGAAAAPAGPIAVALGYKDTAKGWVRTSEGKTDLLEKIKVALELPAISPVITAVLSSAASPVTVEQAKAAINAPAPAPAVESRMFSSLDILLESGRITQEDYNRTSKRLLRTSSIINEAAPPTDAEKTAAIAGNKAKFGGFASSIEANCKTLDTALKALQTLGQDLAKQPVSESLQTQVFKAHIKKRILQETAGKDSREQLNEFFIIAALLAALTGAIAWAAAKIGDFFKNSEYSRSSPTYSSPSTPEQIAKATADLGSSLTAAYGPDGMLVDAAGRRVAGESQVKTSYIRTLEACVKAIGLSMAWFITIEDEAKAATPAAAAETLTEGAQLAAFLGVTDPGKRIAAQTALVLLGKYRNPETIKTAVDKVTTALTAV